MLMKRGETSLPEPPSPSSGIWLALQPNWVLPCGAEASYGHTLAGQLLPSCFYCSCYFSRWRALVILYQVLMDTDQLDPRLVPPRSSS